MARSSLSSRFRRLDIDQFDENRFVEEPDGAEAGIGGGGGGDGTGGAAEGDPGGPGPEVEAALRQYPSSEPADRGVRGWVGEKRDQGRLSLAVAHRLHLVGHPSLPGDLTAPRCPPKSLPEY
ncbi:hypothetical protein JRQ81_008536 [Phrynocephalus forsythii]|uniref:Uncharacterized protein n=1 Tax=Phrynocephalus forsythii TaxID=171643 RepID=A0A9Q0XAA6_9SAUR|nr:hypothetical protein JRQ81_008536 [Phrynocephalus forsythii]